jgi:hypothetical protein
VLPVATGGISGAVTCAFTVEDDIRPANQIAIESAVRLARLVRRWVVEGISRLIHAATSIPSPKSPPTLMKRFSDADTARSMP